MVGTADAGPDGRPRPERCARLVLLCTRTALRLSPFMAAEMESARLTALSVLSRHATAPAARAPSAGITKGGAAGTTKGEARMDGTAARRRTAALLDRLGLLSRGYPHQAAVQAAQAVSIIAGAGPAATRQATARRDAQLRELLWACTALCEAKVEIPPPPAPAGDATIHHALAANA
jgi:hypothetical protein